MVGFIKFPSIYPVNLLAKRGEDVYVDTLDLYVVLVRGLFIVQAAKELGLSEDTIMRDAGGTRGGTLKQRPRSLKPPSLAAVAMSTRISASRIRPKSWPRRSSR